MWRNTRGELNAIAGVLAAVGGVAGAAGAFYGDLPVTVVCGLALALAVPVVARLVYLRGQRDGDGGERGGA